MRAIVRRSTGAGDLRLREVIHGNYLEYEVIADAFAGIDAFFSSAGVSRSGRRRPEQPVDVGAAEIFRPVLRAAFKPFRSMYIENVDIGRAMLEATTQNLRRRILENAAIRDLADQWGGRVIDDRRK